MRQNRARDTAGDLDDDVPDAARPRIDFFLAKQRDESHGRIEVRAADRSEDGDQHAKNGYRRRGVSEKRDGGVSASKTLGHDARSR